MNKKTIIILISVIVLYVLGVLFFMFRNEVENVNESRLTTNTNNLPANNTQKEFCYFKQTTGSGITDSSFISVNYDVNGGVHGLINWIPAEKDSLVGSYTGTVEKSDVPSYPNKLNIIYSGWGEGVLSRQQEIILVGANDVRVGSGEESLDKDGTYVLKDMNKVTYDVSTPLVDCSTVDARFKTDYSKVTK